MFFNVSFISSFVLYKLVLVPLCTHYFGVFMLHVDSLFGGGGGRAYAAARTNITLELFLD